VRATLGHRPFPTQYTGTATKGSKAKPYQVKQVRGILVKYQLGETDVAQVRVDHLLEQ
jgi:hypothetical protein